MLQAKHNLFVLALLPVLTAETCGARKGTSTASALLYKGNQSVPPKMPDRNLVQVRTAVATETQVSQPISENRDQTRKSGETETSVESETDEKDMSPTNDMESETEDEAQGKKREKSRVGRVISKIKKIFGRKGKNKGDSHSDTDSDSEEEK